MSWMAVSQIGLWIMMLVLLAFMFSLMKMVGQFLYRFRLAANQVEERGLKVGQSASLFRGKDQFGQTVRLANHSNVFTLLIFVEESCPVCHRVIKQLSSLINPFDVRGIIISRNKPENEELQRYSGAHFIEAPEAFEDYYVQKVPNLVLLNRNNEIAGLFGPSDLDSLKEILKDSVSGSNKAVPNF